MPASPASLNIPITQEVRLGGQALPVEQGLLAGLFRLYPAWLEELLAVLPEGHAGLHAAFTLRAGRLWVTGVWVRMGDALLLDRRVLEVLFFGMQPPVLAWWVNESVPIPSLRNRLLPSTTSYRSAKIRNGFTLGGSAAARRIRGMAHRPLEVRCVIALTAMVLTPLVCYWLILGRWPHLRFEGRERFYALLLSPLAPFLSFSALIRTQAWSRPLPDVVHQQVWLLMTFIARRKAMDSLLRHALAKGKVQ